MNVEAMHACTQCPDIPPAPKTEKTCTIAETHLQAKGRKQCGRHLSVTQNSLAHWSLDVLNFKSNNMAKQEGLQSQIDWDLQTGLDTDSL